MVVDEPPLKGTAGVGQGTSLVHAAYLRLTERGFRDRAHFLSSAAQAMRHVLVDGARRRAARIRGDLGRELPEEGVEQPAQASSLELIALDEALDRLRQLWPRKARVVELRFFGGLSNDEVSAAVGVSLATVKRDWHLARAWLYRDIHGRPNPSA